MTSFDTYDKPTLDTKFAGKLGTTDTAADSAKFNGQTEAELLGLTDGEPTNANVAILFSKMDTSGESETSQLLNNTVLQASIEKVAQGATVAGAINAGSTTLQAAVDARVTAQVGDINTVLDTINGEVA